MARSHWVVDIAALKRQPGTQHPFRLTVPPPEGVTLETAEIVANKLDIDLQLEMAGAELIAQGTVAVAWEGPCRRCLETQRETLEFDVREIFERVPDEGETYPLDEDQVDLEPMIREAVLLNLPVAPLCRDDCGGPDPERFPTSVASDDVHGDASNEGGGDPTPLGDPRWAALSELTFDD